MHYSVYSIIEIAVATPTAQCVVHVSAMLVGSTFCMSIVVVISVIGNVHSNEASHSPNWSNCPNRLWLERIICRPLAVIHVCMYGF